MDMDSSSHRHNWLAFSLSNPLFEPFNPNSRNDVDNGATGTTSTDLSTMLNCASPKLEDFLGGGANGCFASAGGADSTDVCQLTGEASSAAVQHHRHHHHLVNTSDMDDSELKSIAASFLRGYSPEQPHLTQSHKQLEVAPPPEPPQAKMAVETFGQRTPIFRGVTRHRWTGRYEAHLWDNTCRREGQSRKGRQVYLGGYDKEVKAARAYDLAALKYWGPATTTNFPVSHYEKELEAMKHMTRQEFVASLRRKSSGFSRGASIYRGVTRHHQHGRWQARIGRVAGNKDLYLGTFSTQEEAAEAYDIAAIKFRGLNVVTNFDIRRYDVKSIASSNLPVGGMANKSHKTPLDSDNRSGDGSHRYKDHDHSPATSVSFPSQPSTSSLGFGGLPINKQRGSLSTTSDFWSSLGYPNSGAKAIPFFQNPSPNGTTLECGTPPQFNLDLPPVTNTNIDGFFSSGGYFQQSNIGENIDGPTAAAAASTTSGVAPLVTRIGLSSNGRSASSTYDPANFDNWISPSLHSFQPAKPNLSAFQTPIFGME